MGFVSYVFTCYFMVHLENGFGELFVFLDATEEERYLLEDYVL
jgi:hypothetical protein